MATHDNGAIDTPDWQVDPRACPFCCIPALSCGCPEGDRISDNIYLGEN